MSLSYFPYFTFFFPPLHKLSKSLSLSLRLLPLSYVANETIGTICSVAEQRYDEFRSKHASEAATAAAAAAAAVAAAADTAFAITSSSVLG